jgi:hypothetical protein
VGVGLALVSLMAVEMREGRDGLLCGGANNEHNTQGTIAGARKGNEKYEKKVRNATSRKFQAARPVFFSFSRLFSRFLNF